MLRQLQKSVAAALHTGLLADIKVDEASAVRGGRNDLFTISNAVVRNSGKQVSVFTVVIKEVVMRCESPDEALAVLDAVRKGVALLTRLRHPHILSVERPLVEDKKRLCFVTERVVACLPDVDTATLPHQLKVLELWHCANAMRFVHEQFGTLLINFCPMSIYVTSGEGWKLGDLIHACSRDAIMRLPPRVCSSFGGLSAPLLDYTAYEYVVSSLNTNTRTDDLFVGQGPQSLVFPDSDVFSFALVCVEVLSGRRLFRCSGQPGLQEAQRADVEREMALIYPFNVLNLPRPALSVLVTHGPFATPEIQLLIKMEGYGTMDSTSRFAVLKGLYDALGSGVFCEDVVVQHVVPVLRRESKETSMLRFILPILLQCAASLSDKLFRQHLRDYFSDLVRAITVAPSQSTTEVLAQQILQMFGSFHRHFGSSEDESLVVLPFLCRCAEATSSDSTVRLTVSALRTVLFRSGAGPVAIPSALGVELVRIAVEMTDLLDVVCECLERVVELTTDSVKAAIEVTLVSALAGLSFKGYPSDGQRRLMCITQAVEDGMSREHQATKSIPLLSPLLLSSSGSLQAFAVESIERLLGYVKCGCSGAQISVNAITPPHTSHAPVDTKTLLPFSDGLSSAGPGRPTQVSDPTTDDVLDIFGIH